MADFEFLQNPVSKKWIVLSPRRAKRPNVAHGLEPLCPFCIGKEEIEKAIYEVKGNGIPSEPWKIRVVNNKFPFAPIHEIIIHSPDHHKNFGELPLEQTELILKTYRQRYNAHKNAGQVYIFHNRHEGGGESLPHPHSQLTVINESIQLDSPRLANESEIGIATKDQIFHETKYFTIFCPMTSQWPDEVWIAPKEKGKLFGDIKDEEISDLSFILSKLIQILDLRHGLEFPFNFYIYPGANWYLRIIPRIKVLGGFEIGTGVFVNTQSPKETIMFIKEHFETEGNINEEKIKTDHAASYEKRV